jgi:tetratricopeptide (TPR) repeat protein
MANAIRQHEKRKSLNQESHRHLLIGALLLLLPALFYLPAINGGFIWDDNVMLTDNPYIKANDGLRTIWFSTKLTDYLPLTSTTFWIEWRLWGMNPAGYRIINLLLHGMGAVLLWRVLLRLKIPGSWLAAALFAVHPVCVASVAWIAERKNTLSLVFYLLALTFYLRSEQEAPKAHKFYGLALAAFVLALLSKSAVVMFPVILLGLAAWQRAEITKRDIIRTAPFFILSLAFGLLTIWFQFHRSLGEAKADTLNFAGKAVAATWAIWFYVWKAICPTSLSMIYSQWQVELTAMLSYVPAVALATVLFLFWSRRQSWGRHGLFAAFYFIVTLFPVLGFVDMYYLTFSRVADHWQYLALIGIIVPLASLATVLWKSRGASAIAGRIAVAAAILILGSVTWKQSTAYADSETLWRDTLNKNPNSWAAHNNFGRALHDAGKTLEAIPHYEAAIRINPGFSKAHYNLGVALEQTGRDEEAAAEFAEAIRLEPRHVISMNHLGNICFRLGRIEEAIAHYEKAISIKGDFSELHNNFANVLARTGRLDEAIEHYALALEAQPDYPEAHNNLATAMEKRGDIEKAIFHYRQAIQLRPAYAQAHMNLAVLFLTTGKLKEAKAAFENTLALQSFPEAHYNLGLILAEEGNRADAARHFTEALQQRPDFAEARRELEALNTP